MYICKRCDLRYLSALEQQHVSYKRWPDTKIASGEHLAQDDLEAAFGNYLLRAFIHRPTLSGIDLTAHWTKGNLRHGRVDSHHTFNHKDPVWPFRAHLQPSTVTCLNNRGLELDWPGEEKLALALFHVATIMQKEKKRKEPQLHFLYSWLWLKKGHSAMQHVCQRPHEVKTPVWMSSWLAILLSWKVWLISFDLFWKGPFTSASSKALTLTRRKSGGSRKLSPFEVSQGRLVRMWRNKQTEEGQVTVTTYWQHQISLHSLLDNSLHDTNRNNRFMRTTGASLHWLLQSIDVLEGLVRILSFIKVWSWESHTHPGTFHKNRIKMTLDTQVHISARTHILTHVCTCLNLHMHIFTYA